MTILKELPLLSGQLNVHGTLSYVAQQPWIFSASLRQNILFGQKYDKVKYNRIVQVCALKKVSEIFFNFSFVFVYVVGNLRRGWPEGSLFNSYYTEV